MADALPPLLTLAAAGVLYATGVRRLWRRAGSGRVVRRWQVWSFAAGSGTAAAVLVGPLDHLVDRYLWAHMTQHMVLIVVAAPLLVLGAPLPASLWALPDPLRRRVAPWWRRANRSVAGRLWGAWATAAFCLHAAAVWAWHAPGPYAAALDHPIAHVAEHASFLLTGVLFWWTVLAARRRESYGLGVLAVFLMAFQGTALGAWMTIASAPWYGAYAAGHHGLSALDDQQLAGVIMWCPGGFAYLFAAMAMVHRWLSAEDRRHPAVPVTA